MTKPQNSLPINITGCTFICKCLEQYKLYQTYPNDRVNFFVPTALSLQWQQQIKTLEDGKQFFTHMTVCHQYMGLQPKPPLLDQYPKAATYLPTKAKCLKHIVALILVNFGWFGQTFLDIWNPFIIEVDHFWVHHYWGSAKVTFMQNW